MTSRTYARRRAGFEKLGWVLSPPALEPLSAICLLGICSYVPLEMDCHMILKRLCCLNVHTGKFCHDERVRRLCVHSSIWSFLGQVLISVAGSNQSQPLRFVCLGFAGRAFLLTAFLCIQANAPRWPAGGMLMHQGSNCARRLSFMCRFLPL